MKGGNVPLRSENYNAIIKQYTPLIEKFTYQFYQQYHTVLDYEDARQEVLLCLWRCLLRYDPNQSKFITFFFCSFGRMKSRFYWSYFHQINIEQKKDDTAMSTDGKRVVSDEDVDVTRSEERFVQDEKLDIRKYLTPESLQVYGVYLKCFRVNPHLVSKELNLSRYHARERCDKFKSEVARFCEV